MRYSQKLYSSFGLIGITSIIAILGALGAAVWSKSSFSHLFEEEVAIATNIQRMEKSIGTIRGLEQQFLLYKQNSYVEGFEQNLLLFDSLYDTTYSMVHQNSALKNHSSSMDTLRSFVHDYANKFQGMVEIRRTFGLSADNGIQWDLGVSRKKLQEFVLDNIEVIPSYVVSLVVSTIDMTVTPDDFLQAHSDEELQRTILQQNENVAQSIEAIGELISELEVESFYKNELITLFETYKKHNSHYTTLGVALIQKSEQTEESITLLEGQTKRLVASISMITDQKIDTVQDHINHSILVIISIVVVMVTATIFLVRKLIRVLLESIGAEPQELSHISQSIAKGNVLIDDIIFDTVIPHSVLADMKVMVENLQKEVDVATKIAKGNITEDAYIASENDALGNAMETIITSLNSVTDGIRGVASKLNLAADKVTEASRTVSMSSGSQAASIEEIAATMDEVTSRSENNATTAYNAVSLVTKAEEVASKGVTEMRTLSETMEGITTSSQEIVQVIKVIDDIAFQTNLLALNAAVEAARAGQHGKGFAVVAEEVRNLASRSAEAAQETEKLILHSNKIIADGAEITIVTSQALEEIVNIVTEVAHSIGTISEASEEQSSAIKEIHRGLDHLSDSIQQNSAIAEESSADAEELRNHAIELLDLVNFFKTKQTVLESGKEELEDIYVSEELPYYA